MATGLFRLLTPRDVCALRLVARELRDTLAQLPFDWSAWRDGRGRREREARVDPLHIRGWRAALPRARSLCLERRLLKRGVSLAVFAAELVAGGGAPTELRVLDLSRNGDAFGAQGARVVAASVLPACGARLVELNLAGCSLRALGAGALAGALPLAPRLRVLDLAGNKLGPAGAAALAGGLPACAGLRDLQLSFNFIEDAGLRALAPALAGAPLEALDLRTNGVGAAGVAALAAAMRLLGEGRGDDRANGSDDDDDDDAPGGGGSRRRAAAAAAAAAARRRLGTLGESLVELRLGDNPLGPEGARALAAALPACARLAVLDVSDADLADDGARALADALPACAALAELLLAGNRVGPGGAAALADALPHAPALRVLVLNDNFAVDEGARALAAALPRCAAIERLALARNRVGEEGAAALKDAQSRCRALVSVDVDVDADAGVNDGGADAELAAAEDEA